MKYYIQIATNKFYNDVITFSVSNLPFRLDKPSGIPDKIAAEDAGWIAKPYDEDDPQSLVPTAEQVFTFEIYDFSVEADRALLDDLTDEDIVIDANAVPSLVGLGLNNIELLNNYTYY